MGVMKLLSTQRGRKRVKAEEVESLVVVPLQPRAPGPVTGPLPAACPGKASEGCIRAIMSQDPQKVWEAINTGHKIIGRPVYSQWVSRRGAVFLYNRMIKREMKLRGMQFANEPLYCREFSQLFIHPSDAAYVRPLDSHGRLTAHGLQNLDDVEFVWPWLDELPSDLSLVWTQYAHKYDLTYMALGLSCERAWPAHYIGGDVAGRPMGPDEPSTFALTYAALLKEAGRGGSGTRLGKWLDAWLERADKELRRLHP